MMDARQLRSPLSTSPPGGVETHAAELWRQVVAHASMIEHLVTALQALAAPAGVQSSRFPEFVAKADELALDFDDALRLTFDCPQIQLENWQREALQRLDQQIEQMSGGDNADLWTEAALREAKEWAEVRQLAAAALRVLGQPVATSPPSRSVYIRDRAT